MGEVSHEGVFENGAVAHLGTARASGVGAGHPQRADEDLVAVHPDGEVGAAPGGGLVEALALEREVPAAVHGDRAVGGLGQGGERGVPCLVVVRG